MYLQNFELFQKKNSKIFGSLRIFLCFPIHKKLNKSCSLDNFFFLKKKVVGLKKNKICHIFFCRFTHLTFMAFRYEKCMVAVTAIFSSVLGIFSNSEKIGWFGFWKKFWMEICFLFLLTFRRSNWSSDSFYCIGKKDIFGIDFYK